MSWEDRDAVRTMLRRVQLIETDDAGTQQKLKLSGLKTEQFEDIVRIGQHGFTSHAPKDSEGLLLALSGRSSRAMALGLEHKDHRPKNVGVGGTALYDAFGKIWKFVEAETVFDAGGKPVTIRNATTIKIEGQGDVAVGVPGRWVRVRPGRIDLGVPSPTGEGDAKVMTEAGASPYVWAKT